VTRIVAGTAGGRRIAVPAGDGTRPTTDRVREALFSSLEAEFGSLEGLSVLDLYAGSGAVGLEALSRGAVRVLLVESDRRAAAIVSENLAALGLDGGTVAGQAVETLAGRENQSAAYDLVYADPPYAVPTADLQRVLTDLAANGWLTGDAVVVVERGKREPWTWPDGFAPLRHRKYGETVLWYGHRS
jgi:16S rRNA (guanine966-N2)-methyltransferase